MSDVSVKVNGNPYRLACAVGDEERIERLAAYVDKTCKALIVKLGQISENRLLLMAAVLIADELFEHLDDGEWPMPQGGTSEEELTEILDRISYSIDGIADRLA
jgi:cell division protein ZapA